jgi:GH35 family endo-1,4-beta-xylanase
MNEPKFPHIEVQLTGIDGNAISVMGAVAREMKRDPEAKLLVNDFMEEAMSGDYDHLLQTCTKWVEVV